MRIFLSVSVFALSLLFFVSSASAAQINCGSSTCWVSKNDNWNRHLYKWALECEVGDSVPRTVFNKYSYIRVGNKKACAYIGKRQNVDTAKPRIKCTGRQVPCKRF